MTKCFAAIDCHVCKGTGVGGPLRRTSSLHGHRPGADRHRYRGSSAEFAADSYSPAVLADREFPRPSAVSWEVVMGSAIACRVCLHSAAAMRVRPVARPGWAPERAPATPSHVPSPSKIRHERSCREKTHDHVRSYWLGPEALRPACNGGAGCRGHAIRRGRHTARRAADLGHSRIARPDLVRSR